MGCETHLQNGVYGLGLGQDVSWVIALAGVMSSLCESGVCVYAISTWNSCLPGLSVKPVKIRGHLEEQQRMPVALEGGAPLIIN